MWDLNNLWKPITRAFYCVHSDEGFIRRRSEKATAAKQNDGDTFLPPVFIWLAVQLPCRVNDTCTFDTCAYQGYTVNSCSFDCVYKIYAVQLSEIFLYVGPCWFSEETKRFPPGRLFNRKNGGSQNELGQLLATFTFCKQNIILLSLLFLQSISSCKNKFPIDMEVFSVFANYLL